MAHAKIETRNSEPMALPEVPDLDALMKSLNGEAVQETEKEPTAKAAVDSVEPAPQEKKKTPAKERKEKAAPAAAKRERKKSGSEAPKKMMGIYFTEEMHRRLKIAALQKGEYLTDMISSVCEDALQYTYRCNDAACGMDFVLRSSIAGPAPAPKCCPYCAGTRISHLRG